MLFKSLTFVFMAVLTLLTIWAVGWLWFAASVISMKPQQPDMKTDAIVVLTGGPGRVNEGLDLLSDGKAAKLFISGVDPRVSVEDLIKIWKPSAEKAPCCVTLGYEAGDTAGNAAETSKWAQKNGISSLRLVTSNHHMRRSAMEFRQTMPEITLIRHPVQADDFEPHSRLFWSQSFEEYNKCLLIWLHFHILNSLDKKD